MVLKKSINVIKTKEVYEQQIQKRIRLQLMSKKNKKNNSSQAGPGVGDQHSPVTKITVGRG